MERFLYLFVLSACGILAADGHNALAQRVRFPSDIAPVDTQTAQYPQNNFTQTQGVPQQWQTIPPYSGPLSGNGTTVSPPLNGSPAATISPPNFDGFSTQPGMNLPPAGSFPPAPAYPGQPGFTGSVQPMITPPNGATGLPDFNPNPSIFQTPQLPPISGPSTWFDSFQWPAGGELSNTGSQQGSRDWIGRSFWSKFEKGPYLSLFQEFRFGQTYLYGSTGNQVSFNDTELGTTINYPNLFGLGEPLRISPGFILHLWDGPQPPPAGHLADLPSRAYSAFIATDYSSPADRTMGYDINFSIGIYTGFDTIKTQSVRYKGTALGRLRIAPDMTIRLGITYLDRLRYQLLPAFGVFWTPSEDARLELFFPYPKISKRMQQVGNSEVWAYIRGDLGGDTYTIKRADGSNDQVDLVDFRALLGVEWSGYSRASGFIEAGYVFNRDLFYRFNPADNLGLDNSGVIRIGLTY